MQYLLIFLTLTLSACSVGMAASGHKEQDASVIFPALTERSLLRNWGPRKLRSNWKVGEARILI